MTAGTTNAGGAEFALGVGFGDLGVVLAVEEEAEDGVEALDCMLGSRAVEEEAEEEGYSIGKFSEKEEEGEVAPLWSSPRTWS